VTAHLKKAKSRWRQEKKLPALLERLQVAAPTSGEAKMRAGSILKGVEAPASPAVESLAKLPGAGQVVPTASALRQIRSKQPSLLRRVVEGSGLSPERDYPAFRAQAQPFTGRAVDGGYAHSDNREVMHVAPRAGGAEGYFRRAGGDLPGHAAIGAFEVPKGTPWYAHMEARAAQFGRKPQTYSRHHPEAHETILPPQKPLLGFFGEQNLGGRAVETTNVDPLRLQEWYRSYSRPVV
jgi:hypothetical protein